VRSKLVRMAKLRRRVHDSWKVTLVVALLGWLILGYAGLIHGAAGFFVVLGVLLFRPLMEVWFSNQFFCPHCGADVFLEVAGLESKGGKVEEAGLKCLECGGDVRDRGNVIFDIVE